MKEKNLNGSHFMVFLDPIATREFQLPLTKLGGISTLLGFSYLGVQRLCHISSRYE